MRKIEKNKIHRILAVRTDRMGDVLLNIPAIRALKQTFNAPVSILAKPDLKEILETVPEIDEVIPFDENRWNQGISARIELLHTIRKKDFNLAVILNPTKRFHMLIYLAKVPERLGYDRKWGLLLTHKIEDKKYEGKKHEVEYNLDLVRSIGADTNDKHISIEVNRDDAQFVRDLCYRYHIKDEDVVIAIQPHSSNPAKCWPQQNFAHLADELSRQLSAKVAIIGALQDRNSAIKLISLSKQQPLNLCGKLSLRQLAAFLKQCALLISNDSGPVHIAAAVNTPTTVIFGRNIPGVGPRRWAPWDNKHVALHKDPGCNPCLDRDCPYQFKCLKAITADEVLRVAESQLRYRR